MSRYFKLQKDNVVTYKGYVIQAASRENVDTSEWGVNFFILWSTEAGEESRHFYTIDQYATKEEATATCMAYGRLIIDGKVPGVSVGRLGEGKEAEPSLIKPPQQP